MAGIVACQSRNGGVSPVRRVAVVCESTACLPGELVQRYAIGVVPVPFMFGSHTLLDGVDLTPAEFYARLEACRVPPRTSPPEPGAYLKAWQVAARDVEALVLVTTAGTIATFQRSANLARSELPTYLPGKRVEILDSGTAGMGQGFVVLAAARAAERGLDLESVYAAAATVARRVDLVVTLDTLRYLARASRIPTVAALAGSVLNVKPIIRLVQGQVEQLGRVHSRRRSLEEVVAAVCRLVPSGAPLHLAVQHARAPSEASWLLDQLRHRRECVEAYIAEFTPVMGAYCGPGLVGAAFHPELPELG